VVSREWVRQSVAPAIQVGTRTPATRYGLKWWLFPHPTDSTRVMWAGSGFGGQFPLAFPEDDLIVVVNAWNILPGRPSLPLRPTLERILRTMR
jgi:hypothetical protein